MEPICSGFVAAGSETGMMMKTLFIAFLTLRPRRFVTRVPETISPNGMLLRQIMKEMRSRKFTQSKVYHYMKKICRQLVLVEQIQKFQAVT